jgi:cysteine desulfuration protein SufE
LPFPADARFSRFAFPELAPAAAMSYMSGMHSQTAAVSAPSIEQIVEDFALLDEWEDRYRYVIELGKALPPLSDEDRSPANKVQGCVSQVWVATDVDRTGPAPVLTFRGDSDAHIVRGLIAILFALYSGKTAPEIVETDAAALLGRIGLEEHLTPQRSNGLRAMVERMRSDAGAVLN